MKTAAIYCRVSTFEQSQGEFSSLDAQSSTLSDYCNSKGWDVYKVYSDTKSGKSLKREKIQELLSDAEDKKFDVIIATKLDRLSRSIRDFFELDDRLFKLGIDIVITTQNIDTTTPGGRAMRNMMLVFAEFEREMISQRTKEKLYTQAQKGYWGGGHTILGYDVVEKKLVINEEEATIVRRIFNLYNEGKSSVAIAETLNKEGYKTKERKSKGKVISDKYNKDSVLRILKNKTYIGKITIKKNVIDGKTLDKPQEEEFKGLHEPIIDQKTFETANYALEQAKNNKFLEYKGSQLILLQKLICGICGSLMTTTFTTKSNGVRVYGYKCSAKGKKGSSFCKSKDAPAKAIEDFIIKLLINIGSTEEVISSVFKQSKENDESIIKEKTEQLAKLKRNLNEVNVEAKNTIKLLSKNPDINDLGTVKEVLFELDEKKKTISNKIDELEDEIVNLKDNENMKESVEYLLTEVPGLLNTLSKDEQRKLLSFIINEIIWKVKSAEKEGEIEIFFRGNGRINKKWVNNVNPSPLVSSFCLDWLREQDSNLQPFG